MDNKYMRKCSADLASRETPIKISLKSHLSIFTLAITTNITIVETDVEKLNISVNIYYCCFHRNKWRGLF